MKSVRGGGLTLNGVRNSLNYVCRCSVAAGRQCIRACGGTAGSQSPHSGGEESGHSAIYPKETTCNYNAVNEFIPREGQRRLDTCEKKGNEEDRGRRTQRDDSKGEQQPGGGATTRPTSVGGGRCGYGLLCTDPCSVNAHVRYVVSVPRSHKLERLKGYLRLRYDVFGGSTSKGAASGFRMARE
jgi:hypothetical protein